MYDSIVKKMREIKKKRIITIKLPLLHHHKATLMEEFNVTSKVTMEANIEETSYAFCKYNKYILHGGVCAARTCLFALFAHLNPIIFFVLILVA